MTINYEKLWNMLDAQGISKDQLRKASGLTTYVFDKIEKNGSVQFDALIKVCGVLNCAIGDIVDVEYDYEKKRAIPNVDFTDVDAFSAGGQFEQLGFNTLYDLPIYLNVVSLQNFLAQQLVSAKLSFTACEELISALGEHGITIILPDGIEPSLDNLPKEIEETDGEYDAVALQQIDNYISWVLTKYTKKPQMLADKLDATRKEPRSKQYYVETGILHAPKDGKHFEYEGLKQTTEENVYPFSVLPHIFGSLNATDLYVLSHRIPDITQYIDECVSSSPEAALLFNLKVKLGLPAEEMLRFLGLPLWESFVYGIDNHSKYKRLIRRLRHPRYSKSFKGQWMIQIDGWTEDCMWEMYDRCGPGMDPYQNYVPAYTDKIYNQFVDTIKDRISASVNQGMPLTEALGIFYPAHVVAAVEQNVATWYNSFTPAADHIKLSWKAYQALKMGGIETISQVLYQHGDGLSLNEVEKSGLRQVPGIEDQQITEILQGLRSLLQQPMDRCFIENMVEFAEKVCNTGGKWPVYKCIGITHSALKMLLDLQYRDVNTVIADYNAGVLQEKCQPLSGTKAYIELIDCIRIVATGEYPMTHIVFSDFWKNHIECSEQSLQDMRMAYVQDSPMPYGIKKIEANIHMLFPGESEAFRLLYNTRGCHMKWVPWPIDTLVPTVISCVGNNKSVEIESAYYGLDASFFTKGYEAWPTMSEIVYVFAKVFVEGEIQYLLYRLDLGKLKLVAGIQQNFLSHLFASVSFNAQICYAPKIFTKEFKNQFYQSLGYFCMRGLASTESEEEKDLYMAYPVYIERCREKIASKVEQMKCADAGFSISTQGVLKAASIDDMSMLAKMNITDFLEIPEIRDRHVAEIIKKLQSYGIIIPEWENWLSNYAAKPRDYLDMTIDELDLSVRSFNCLKRAGIDTVGDLLSYGGDPMRIRNMGKKSLDEIEKKLEKLGLKAQWMLARDYSQANNQPFSETSSLCTEPIMAISVVELDFGIKVYSALRRYGILCVRDLICKTEKEYLSMPGFSKQMVEEIICKLKYMGLNLKEEHDAL